ncbi:hypothetical protein BC833DRAFT_566462, partial [Globomyces pollinis-pini]
FTLCYSVVWTPLNALYPAEILSFKSRATGMAMLQFFINIVQIFNSFVLAKGLAAYKYKFFIFYIAFDAFAAAFVYKVFPETLGRTDDEIDEIFASGEVVKRSLDYQKSDSEKGSLKQRKQ